MMRIIIALATAVVLAAPPLPAQKLSIRPAAIRDTLLTRILVRGEEVPIADSVMEKYSLYMRLWRVGNEGGCQEAETYCSYSYYLAVADLGEDAPTTVYSLGEVGEIVNLTWLPAKRSGSATLRVETINWPKSVLETEKELKRASRSYKLEISTQSITARPT